MTWAEFQIRLFAFKRIELKKDIRFREVAYNARYGMHMQTKKIPSKKQFWDLGLKKTIPKLSEKAREIFKREQEKYNNRHNGR